MATGGQFVRSVEKASEECFDFVCSPCAADDRNMEAVKYCPVCQEYLCSRCLTEHGRFASMKSHKLQNPAAVTRKGQPPGRFIPTERCSIHHGKPIDTYCGNHDVLCCGTCVSVNHWSCVEIACIPDAAIGVTKSWEYKNIKNTMGKVQSKLQQLMKTKQDDRNHLNKDKKTCLTKIHDFRETLNKHLDDLEKAAIKEVHTKHKEYEDKVNSEIKALSGMISVLEASIDQVKKVNTDNEPQVFVDIKIGKRNQNDGEKLLQEMEASPKPEPLNFQINTTMKDAIMSEKSLGDFKQADDLDDQIYTASLRGHYNVKVKCESDCNVTGSCLLPDGKLLITDWNNNKVKRLNQSYQVTDWCEFPAGSRPYGVCATGPSEAAVALCVSRKIQFVSLGKKMTLKKSFHIGEQCYGVAFINGELFVLCPNLIQTYHIAGKFLRIFETDAAWQEMFPYPSHISVSTDSTLIHVSDLENGVITLDRQGNIQSQFTDPDLNSTDCVYPCSNGQMFVCSCDSNNVLQISRGVQKLGVLLDESHGVRKPKSLLYDSANSRLVVTMQSDNIAVFNLSRK